MTSDEIRERYLSFFEERGHTAHPLGVAGALRARPLGAADGRGDAPAEAVLPRPGEPPAPRLTSCQKCFRTVDIDNVGNTARHLTFFEMLGNFSFGDYFKREAIEFAWELSREVFGFAEEDIWVTVFEGDEALGLGPDEEAIELLAGGRRAARADRATARARRTSGRPARPGRAGRARSCTSTAALEFGAAEDLPGRRERALPGVLEPRVHAVRPGSAGRTAGSTCEPLPANNIDTGLGLNRMAAILQGKASVFETDQFQPLIELGEELSGPALRRGLRRPTGRCGSSPTTRAR